MDESIMPGFSFNKDNVFTIRPKWIVRSLIKVATYNWKVLGLLFPFTIPLSIGLERVYWKLQIVTVRGM